MPIYLPSILKILQIIKARKTVVALYQTSSYIVRSIMNDAVEKTLAKRGEIKDFRKHKYR